MPAPATEALYAELAPWWSVLSPSAHHAGEARACLGLLTHALGRPPRSLLELGCGVAPLAAHLPEELDLVLVDRSPSMLAESRRRNPRRAHVQADMRDLALDRRFDAVLLHDAVMYLPDPVDLAATLAVAARHLDPGGVILLRPDVVRESFEEGISAGGGGPDWAEGAGRAARLMEWSWDPDPTDTAFRVDMSFLLREADGAVRSLHDVHILSLYTRPQYWQALRAAGFTPVEAPHRLAAATGEVFLGRRA